MQVRGRVFQKGRYIVGAPDFIGPRSSIDSTAFFAWVGRHKAAVQSPRKNKRQYTPSVIRLPSTRVDASSSRHAMNTPRVRRSVIAESGKLPNLASIRLIRAM